MRRDPGVFQDGGGEEAFQKPEEDMTISTCPAEHQAVEGLMCVQWAWQVFRNQEQTDWMLRVAGERWGGGGRFGERQVILWYVFM